MLKNLFYAILLGVGMAACLSQNTNEDETDSEQLPEQTTEVIEEPATPTPAPEHFLIRRGRVGNVKIGMPIHDVRTNVAPGFIIADTTLQQEGQASTAYNLRAQDHAEGILIEQQCETDCQIWRINVKSQDYKTSNGIGVGSKYSEVSLHYPIQTVILADGGLVAVSKDAGMSFVLDPSQIPPAKRSSLTPKTVPANTLVKNVLVY